MKALIKIIAAFVMLLFIGNSFAFLEENAIHEIANEKCAKVKKDKQSDCHKLVDDIAANAFPSGITPTVKEVGDRVNEDKSYKAFIKNFSS